MLSLHRAHANRPSGAIVNLTKRSTVLFYEGGKPIVALKRKLHNDIVRLQVEQLVQAFRDFRKALVNFQAIKRNLAKLARDAVTAEEFRRWADEHCPPLMRFEFTDEGVILDYSACEAMSCDPALSGREERIIIPPMRFFADPHIMRVRAFPWPYPSPTNGIHPHIGEDGRVCLGNLPADYNGPSFLPILAHSLRELRRRWCADYLVHPRWVRPFAWMHYKLYKFAYSPIEGLDGKLYPDLQTLLASTPRAQAKTPLWICERCECVPCECCPDCGRPPYDCTCNSCPRCGYDCAECYLCGEQECQCECPRCHWCGSAFEDTCACRHNVSREDYRMVEVGEYTLFIPPPCKGCTPLAAGWRKSLAEMNFAEMVRFLSRLRNNFVSNSIIYSCGHSTELAVCIPCLQRLVNSPVWKYLRERGIYQ